MEYGFLITLEPSGERMWRNANWPGMKCGICPDCGSSLKMRTSGTGVSMRATLYLSIGRKTPGFESYALILS